MNDVNTGDGETQFGDARSGTADEGQPISFWISIFLGFLLLVSAGLNLILFVVVIGTAGDMGARQDRFKESTIRGEGENKIAVISVNGVISGQSSQSLFGSNLSTVERVKKQLERAEEDDKVKGIILKVNSPGGGVTASDKIHHLLKNFKKEREDVFLLTLMDDVAASGGYYISAPTDRIMAHETTITGSIGVIMQYLVFQGLLKEWGVEAETITPENADHKDMGSPFKKLNEEDRKIFQQIVSRMYNRFLEVVNQGRPNLNMQQVKDLADGRIYTGKTAVENGLVDEIGYFDDAVERAKKEASLEKAKVVKYQEKISLFNQFQSAVGSNPPRTGSRLSPIKQLFSGNNPPEFLYLWSANPQVDVQTGGK